MSHYFLLNILIMFCVALVVLFINSIKASVKFIGKFRNSFQFFLKKIKLIKRLLVRDKMCIPR